MAATMKGDVDAQVTFEDQKKINQFARCNVKLQDVKEELAAKKKDLQNLEDAEEELMMADEGAIPYQVGEIFVDTSSDEATDLLGKAKEATNEEIKQLEAQAENHKKILQDLKVQLYAKFGTNINLEAEED